MRISVTILALGAVLAASPALAQINVGGQTGVNVGAGAGLGVDPSGALGGVTGTVDRTVGTVDRTVNRSLDSELRAATSADLTGGAAVRDRRGNRVGTVQSVHGDTAVVVKGDKTMHVPVSQLYRGASGLVTGLSKAQLNAMASATAGAGAGAGADVRN